MSRLTPPAPRASLAALATLLLAGVASLSAAPVAIVNAGFEDITGAQVTVNEFTFGSFPGWSIYDPSGLKGDGSGNTYFTGTLTPTVVPSAHPTDVQFFPGGAPQGSRVGIAFNFAATAGTGEYGLQQTLAATLQANTTYTLTALIGNIASGTDLNGNPYNLNGFPGYRVDLLAGGTVIASDNSSLTGTIPEGEFALSTTSHTTGAADPLLGQNLGIRLVNLNVADDAFPGADIEVDFDDIQLTATPVPEPASAALLAGAAAGLLACRRRRHDRTPAAATRH